MDDRTTRENLRLLHKSIRDGNELLVKTLTETGVSVNEICDNDIALTCALQQTPVNINIINYIIESHNFNKNAVNRYGRTPLFVTSLIGNTTIAKRLIALGADIDKFDNSKVTPLGATAYYNRAGVAEVLIKAGANINSKDSHGQSPLYRACNNVSTEVANVLLQHACDVNTKAVMDKTPLMATVISRNYNDNQKQRAEATKILRQLIKHGCDLNAQDNYGETALHMAVTKKDILTSCILLDMGADVYIENDEQKTPLDVAVSPKKQLYKIALFILLFGYNCRKRLQSNDADINVLRSILEAGKHPIASHFERHRLLRLFLNEMRYTSDDLNALLSSVCTGDVNVERNTWSDVVLVRDHIMHVASLQSICRRNIRHLLGQNIMPKVNTLNVGIHLKKFLSYGFNSTSTNPLQVCELYLALEEGDQEKILAAIETKFDLNATLFGNTPLLFAVDIGKEKSVNLLLKYGANPAIPDVDGNTVLHVSSRRGHDQMLSAFLEIGCNVNLRNHNGNLAIHEASFSGNFSCVRTLIEFGSHVDIPDNNGIYPLHYAAASGELETVKNLIHKNASTDVLDRKGYAPIHLTVTLGVLYLENNISLPSLFKSELAMNCKIFSLMSRSCKKVQLPSENKSKYLKVINELQTAGCDINLETANGQRASELAAEYGFKEFLDVLRVEY